MVSSQLYEVKRDPDGARAVAAPVGPLRALCIPSLSGHQHRDPRSGPLSTTPTSQAGSLVNDRVSNTQALSVAAAVSLCCEAGLLPRDDKAPPIPQRSSGSGSTARNKAAERSSVSVFSKPKARFPLLPMARGTRESYSRERVWVGDVDSRSTSNAPPPAFPAIPSTRTHRSDNASSPTLRVAAYGRMMMQAAETTACKEPLTSVTEVDGTDESEEDDAAWAMGWDD